MLCRAQREEVRSFLALALLGPCLLLLICSRKAHMYQWSWLCCSRALSTHSDRNVKGGL